MSIKKQLFGLPFLLLAISCCSCSLKSFLTADPVENSFAYDLTIPQQKLLSGIHIRVKPFSGNSRSKMAKRLGNRIEFDEKNHWVQPPETLLTRFLTLAFAEQENRHDTPAATNFTVSGNLMGCLWDSDMEKFRMQLAYRIESGAGSEVSGTKEYFVELKNADADSQAKAFSLCADNFANDILDFIKHDIAEK